MICPYCGKEAVNPQKEHFFPQLFAPSQWDFWACRECNKIKREHIVYPVGWLFAVHPPDFSFSKFQRLWEGAPMGKYLNVVPASTMRKSFDSRKWVYENVYFSFEERVFFKLDRMKEIYEWADNLIRTDEKVQALVLSYSGHCLYLLHTHMGECTCKYKEVKPVHVAQYAASKLHGMLMLGSGRYGVWSFTPSYREYFKKLLGAPYTLDM